ncbi:D-alanyl-D-alanine carboxypeptidase/D-alanyl-D-alanine endopeptidase [Pseudoduganella ginsengisoli]|uniref:D-alanyl-D-alanine carboxypeptidase/D-alanyl-D-alanine-endopeptidase n=1 Tax=Pseudoduganella ginsengisoli TaxID=1462440 RepID=A0A6L6Q043_9BURK|nr:D-alanyl-D-alanine carboxypeptidase/D-alanyl-D-alanine-endopeptidase [Pseudoduganella ginsengisoli]MTW02995.1 D-alanyl-D-alanine carboxypeptidase/D-alanyl-D-alanine-endopeptidase [Pseudoduganella ginsengisoli]
MFSILLAYGAAHAALPEPVAKQLQAANIPEDAVGVVVLRGNAVLLSHQADKVMQPASTMKLVTTLAGLDLLGPVFRGRTELRSTGEVAGGTLKGDLYLRGGADADFNEDALVHMLEKLRTAGIRKIDGDLVLDRTLFQPARPDIGAVQFDEYPDAYYNVIPDALLLNMNMSRITIDSTGGKLRFDMLPQLDNVSVASEMVLADIDCAKWEDAWKPPTWTRNGSRITVTLRGSFPRHCGPKTVNVNLLDRSDYAERLFRNTWSKLGGTFRGAAREAEVENATPASSRVLAEHVSRPLADVLRDINKTSDNGLARTLYLSLGSLEADGWLGSRPLAVPASRIPVIGGGPAPGNAGAPAAAILPSAPELTAVRAEQAIRGWLRRQGIDDTGLVLENGSGLSRIERIKPAQMAALLQAAQRSPWQPEFLSSLPIAAVDGTMRRRLAGTPAAMRARMKTGALKNVAAIAGYAPDAHGEPCIVVAFINHDLAGNGNGRKVGDALIEWVAAQGSDVH